MTDIDAEIQALTEAEERARARVLAAVDDARFVFSRDLPRFVEREVKRTFVEAADFAEGLNDARIAELKQAVRDEGRAAADLILESLQDDAPWLAGVAHVSDEDDATQSSFEDNPELWAVVNRIAETATGLLSRFGFPASAEGHELAYHQPAYFVDGRHMKTIAEHYWRGVREIQESRSRRQELDAGRRAQELKARWDTIE